MAPYATTDDLASRWRPLTADEELVADTLLSDAGVWLRAWFPNLNQLVTDGRVDASAPVMVSCSMVKRALLSSGLENVQSEQFTKTAGPYTDSGNRVFSNPEGNLFVTAQERSLLEGQPATAVSVTMRGL